MARRDGDTWDLSSGVGATATGVAVGRALGSRGPNALINDPFAEPLVRAVGVDFFTRVAVITTRGPQVLGSHCPIRRCGVGGSVSKWMPENVYCISRNPDPKVSASEMSGC